MIAGSGTPQGKENAAAHDLQRTTSRLMQSGVAGLPNARFALSADRIADALTLRPPSLRGMAPPIKRMSRGVQGILAIATRRTAPVGLDGEKPQGRGDRSYAAEGARPTPTSKRDQSGGGISRFSSATRQVSAAGEANLRRGGRRSESLGDNPRFGPAMLGRNAEAQATELALTSTRNRVKRPVSAARMSRGPSQRGRQDRG